MAIEVAAYRSRGLNKAVLGDIAGGYRSRGAIEVGVQRRLCWRESFQGI